MSQYFCSNLFYPILPYPIRMFQMFPFPGRTYTIANYSFLSFPSTTIVSTCHDWLIVRLSSIPARSLKCFHFSNRTTLFRSLYKIYSSLVYIYLSLPYWHVWWNFSIVFFLLYIPKSQYCKCIEHELSDFGILAEFNSLLIILSPRLMYSYLSIVIVLHFGLFEFSKLRISNCYCCCVLMMFPFHFFFFCFVFL